MSAEMQQGFQIQFKDYLLPGLGEMVPGPKNVLSPFGLSFERQAGPGELAASGLFDSQGQLIPACRPVMQRLANPTAVVDLRFATGGHLQQFSLYYGAPGTAPILLMNTSEGLLLEYPADLKAIVDGLLHFSSDSIFVSFELDVTLPRDPALVLAALIDLHRRAVARAFADLQPVATVPIRLSEIEHWLKTCPATPQWMTALMPEVKTGPWQLDDLERGLTHLVGQGLCQVVAGGFALTGPVLTLGNRMVIIDNLYALDIARVDTGGQVSLASIIALQAGINDLLQIDFSGDEVSFKSLAPIGFILQLEHILEQGGQVLPDRPVPVAGQPARAVESEFARIAGLRVPGRPSLFPLAESITIGRANTCELTLNDSKASRQHARITQQQDDYWIEDLGSSNGVFVNDKRISTVTRLTPGDQILIGDSRLEVVGEHISPGEAATMMVEDRTAIQLPVSVQAAPPAVQTTCRQCGQSLSPTSLFCRNCGAPTAEKQPDGV